MAQEIVVAPQMALGLGIEPVPQWLRRTALSLTSRAYSVITAPQSEIDAATHWLAVMKAQVAPPATAQEVDDQIDLMSTLPWKQPDSLVSGNDRHESLFRGAFKSDLGHLPAVVLQSACKAARLDAARRYFPTTGELLAYARETQEYQSWALELRLIEGARRLSEARRERPKEDTSVPASAWAELRARLEGKTGKERRESDV